MPFRFFLRRVRAVLLLAVLPAAVCPNTGFAAEAGAGDTVISESRRAPVRATDKAPCPENMNLEFWNMAPTLWRMAYAHCKPAGAPVRRSFSLDDADQFINALGFGYPELGGFRVLRFFEYDSRAFRVVAVMEAESLSVPQAEIIAADILRRVLLYFETNGHNPREEKLRFSSRIRALTDAGDIWVHAIFDNATGNIHYKMLPDE